MDLILSIIIFNGLIDVYITIGGPVIITVGRWYVTIRMICSQTA